MRETLDSVVNQTVLPTKWIIVDDGSTDATPQILKEYSKKYTFIEVVTRENRGHRSVGPGVIDAFYEGYNHINLDEYNYICKLDLDLIMPEQYFEHMIIEMESRPRLGTFSGKAYYYGSTKNDLISENCGDESSIGAAKFYRVNCFKQIGGFVRQVMWDGIDSHRCRLLGWISQSRDDKPTRFVHLRPMGSSQKGILTGRKRHGFGQYFMGTSLVYFLATIIFRLAQRPFIVGAICTLWGYVQSFLLQKERLNDPEMINFMRKYQWQCLLKGKGRATLNANEDGESRWKPEVIIYTIPNKN
jgi:hypothetical protein